jgi:hypothetical protein
VYEPEGTYTVGATENDNVDKPALNEKPSVPIFLILYKFISMSPANVVKDVEGLYKIEDPPAAPLLL